MMVPADQREDFCKQKGITMHDMTADNLRSAYGGESMAHMRYLAWGGKAEKEGYPTVGRLFRAISRAEQAHATGHFRAMASQAGAFAVNSMAGFGLGSTSENLAGAIEGETFEINEMYPAYLEVAKMQDEQPAIQSMGYAISAEKIHAAMFTEAKNAVDNDQDYSVGTIQICTHCGHTLVADEAPDQCPICKVKKEMYVSFSA
jgi:rubrerythrin